MLRIIFTVKPRPPFCLPCLQAPLTGWQGPSARSTLREVLAQFGSDQEDTGTLQNSAPPASSSLTSFLEALLNSRQHWKSPVVKALLSQKPERSFWFHSLSLPSAVDQREPLFLFLARYMNCRERCNDSKGENMQSCITNQFISKQSTPALQICLQLLSAVLFLNCLQVADFSVVLLLPMYTQDLARHNFHYREFKLPEFPAC